ncbi:MAG: DUF294 nucleotidyltransferase-like domain-containing protein, partial [Tepidimonas taiwanensis]|nr:DUF294 nucleotidyltransferase-like domain-containing protein [Tepidimonas taiwanensis]
MNDLGFALRDQLRAEREALIAAYRGGGAVRALLRGLSRATDRLLRRLIDAAGLPPHMAVIAVGGYGRGELYPHSDVDILLLYEADLSEAETACVERLIGQLWDLGLHVGHSVRTLAQCEQEAARDVTVLTALLEARLIVGPRPLFRRFVAAVSRVLQPQAFFRAKQLEQQQRHTKYQDTPYSLEPNVKENPGGLRDLQTVLWVARAAGLGRTWRELARRHLLTREECRMLIAKERVIQQIRAHLHIVAGRREDRLLFDFQDAVARALRINGSGTRRASEVLMQRYYLAAKAVTQLNTLLLLN